LEEIDHYAEQQGLTRSAFLTRAARQAIERQQG
jgi:metal-responsive CopG/Arc/MetJ family transcriptional regulator